ncbi:hypothetical protein COY87_01620 [Candidatus Roizmanbacteria bacterium CG_4_10_14_0_8_um_filter_33_9]|uniref:PGAP1 family protein n=1 Tax=Candidatus Roizmanbacteria bacterium CG_4_10_14_0_8_um_filter_33_9 TaxID=1974826 RepID=A0A2M7QKD3_9BACT|nr:MAG: hypothetical protein COY87_01620 [Candidatus Roizmanbacteria bacterium CG_4_10_14_0_8_um_filter_33_9]
MVYMVKTILKIILFIFIFLISSTVYAIEFTISPSEKLVFENSFENWVEDSGYQPSVTFLNNNYFMFYTTSNNNYSNQKIGYATSTDGINWKKIKVYDFGFSEPVHNPNLAIDKETYILTFAVDTNPRKIMSVTSSDINNFSPSTLKEELLPSQQSDTFCVTDPFRIKEKGTSFLWYAGLSGNGWHLNLAYRENDSWKKCSNNPLLPDKQLSSPSIISYDNSLYVFYRSNEGISYTETTNSISCSITWSSYKTLNESGLMFFPYTVLIKDKIFLYYTKIENGIRSFERVLIYTENRKKSIILIPGLFASWNQEAILHKKTISQADWKLNSIVIEYSGIEKTLQNLGYEKNKDYYLFAYDWRKPIEQIADDLSNFVKAKPKPGFESWNIVGHSLGGLVGKVAIQKNNDFEAKRLITIGSPHFGAAQVYKPLSAGEFERKNTYMWLAQKIIIALYKTKLEPDRETLKTYFPSLQDLFPIYDFLYDESDKPIAFSSLSLKNNTLTKYANKSLSDLTSYFSISGTNIDTFFGYTITKPNLINTLLGNYVDGQPKKALYKEGDRTVLFSSSYENTSQNVRLSNVDHGGLVTTKTGIKTILDVLDISYQEDQVEEGKKTIISPSLIFLIRSPAEMEVVHNGSTYKETDGFIFISNAEKGLYTLKVKGIDLGTYTVTIGQITDTDDIWDTFEGKIINPIPSNQTDTYSFLFNTSKLTSMLTPTPIPSTISVLSNEKTSTLSISCTNSNFDAIMELKIGNKVQKNVKVNFKYNNINKSVLSNNEGKAIAGFVLDKETDLSAIPEAGFDSKQIFVSQKSCKEQAVNSSSFSSVLNLASPTTRSSQSTAIKTPKNTSHIANNKVSRSASSSNNGVVLGTKTANHKQRNALLIIIVNLIILVIFILNRKIIIFWVKKFKYSKFLFKKHKI